MKISGPFTGGLEYDAVLDTGFTGFVSIPLAEAIRLGLVLCGTTSVSFANGETSFRLTAKGRISVGAEAKIGVAILEWQSTEVLLGMAFLRQFGKVLLVTKDTVVLQDQDEPQKKAATDAGPEELPPQTPSQ